MSKESKGLGDTIEKVFKATGIDKVAKKVLGDYCGCEKVAGTDFCKKHQGDLVEGRMNDGICPKISEEHLALLVGNEKYGEENQKQFGMLK